MTAVAHVNRYLTNHYEGMEPEQLILMLYKGALDRIELTRQAVHENDVQKRGENLSKVIAIISELNASVDPEMQDEGTRFLRGLYTAILVELPKVSVDNNTAILDRTEKYIARLKEIWEKDVMGKPAQDTPGKPVVKPGAQKQFSAVPGYGNSSAGKRFSSFSV